MRAGKDTEGLDAQTVTYSFQRVCQCWTRNGVYKCDISSQIYFSNLKV